MHVLYNEITQDYFMGWSSENFIQTTKKKELAEVYVLVSDSREDRQLLTNNWKMVGINEKEV
jgi:hypothetical protein